MPTSIVEVTDTTLDAEVLQCSIPVLLDFWGTGCGACRALAPTVDTIAHEYSGRIKVGKLDAYTHMSSASRFGIRSLPTLLLFKDGQVKEQMVGTVSKEVIARAIDRHL